MSFTVQNVVDLARDWLNDDDKVRVTDAKGERFVNACVQALVLLRPDLFTVMAAITPTADKAQQDLKATDANIIALLDLHYVVGGSASLLECDGRTLLSSLPGAMTATSGVPTDWWRDPGDKDKQAGTRYFLSPPPASGTSLMAQYTIAPGYRTLAQTVLAGGTDTLPEAYRMPLAKAVQYCAETVDDEHVISQRAMEGMQTFTALIGAGASTKKVSPNP